jgi:hypothetical protein
MCVSDVSNDNFHPEFVENQMGLASPTKEMDESKQFFELVQQFMAEYTASSKVRTVYDILHFYATYLIKSVP